MATTVLGLLLAVEQAGVGEAAEQLRDGGSGDAGAAGQLGARNSLGRDRSQRQELRDGQGGLMAGEEPLDPSIGERRDRDQRVGCL